MKALEVIKGFLKKLRRDGVSAYAAQMAFFFIMSAIPLLMLLLSFLQFIPQTQGILEETMENYLPSSIRPFVLGVVQEVYSKSVSRLSITAVVTLWIAAKTMQALAAGLNSVFEIEETRPWVILRLRAALNTLLLIIAIVLLLLLVVFGNSLEALLIAHFPMVGRIMSKFVARRLVISMILLILVFDIFYAVIPNRRASLLSQLPGSLFCTLCWLLFSYGVSIYIDYFNGFSMYGSLTALVVIMFWLYFCMYFLLTGGAINFYFNEAFRGLRKRMRARRRRKNREALNEKGKQAPGQSSSV